MLFPSSRFFWTRNNGGAVLPVGETRRSADFHVSADLTRTSERRLQAEKKMRFEELRSRFPYEFQTFWSPVSEAERTATASAALAAIGGAAAAAASAAAAVAAAAAAAVAEQAPVRIERHTREAAPPRSRRRPPGGHDTGRERGGSGRAPGPSPLLLLLLLLVDPETQYEWHRKEMPEKSCALGPPQAMMKRTFSAPQARKFFAAVLCKKASSTKGMVTPWSSQKSLKARSRRVIIGM